MKSSHALTPVETFDIIAAKKKGRIEYMKKAIAILLIAAMTLAFVACTAKNPLLGTWVGDYDEITFEKDGKCIWGERGDVDQAFRYNDETYTIDGDKVTFEGDTTYTYVIKDNKLIFFYDGEELMTLTGK